GEAQAANGAMFCCANLIFAFTMNLPDGADEAVRKGIGFNNTATRDSIVARVSFEIKRMLSGAFLSRVGAPILFEPIAESALAEIIERAVKTAVKSAAERLSLKVDDVIVEQGVGEAVLSYRVANSASFGARALLERGRALAAEAVTELAHTGADPDAVVRVKADGSGRLKIETVRKANE
ncbi:MAG TPA: hypothetical protein VFV34_12400, partial [Blastocatellia bacterium]|nr:hypothetical protein [Blastocatellia bacterium]